MRVRELEVGREVNCHSNHEPHEGSSPERTRSGHPSAPHLRCTLPVESVTNVHGVSAGRSGAFAFALGGVGRGLGASAAAASVVSVRETSTIGALSGAAVAEGDAVDRVAAAGTSRAP